MLAPHPEYMRQPTAQQTLTSDCPCEQFPSPPRLCTHSSNAKRHRLGTERRCELLLLGLERKHVDSAFVTADGEPLGSGIERNRADIRAIGTAPELLKSSACHCVEHADERA